MFIGISAVPGVPPIFPLELFLPCSRREQGTTDKVHQKLARSSTTLNQDTANGINNSSSLLLIRILYFSSISRITNYPPRVKSSLPIGHGRIQLNYETTYVSIYFH